MKAKKIKDNIDNESIFEDLKFEGHQYKIFKYNDQKIYANSEGILGEHKIFIPWNIISDIKKHLNES